MTKFPDYQNPNDIVFIHPDKADRNQTGTFWGDFSRGLLVVLAIIIGLPLLLLFLWAAKGFALVLLPLLALIVVIALVGRILRFTKQRWPR